jgi:hypothetical protein
MEPTQLPPARGNGGVLEATSSGATLQLGTTTSGSNDLVTSRLAGASANDIDGGATSIQSPQIALPTSGTLTLTLSRYLAHLNNASLADYFRVKIGTASTLMTVFEKLGAAATVAGAWQTANVNLTSFAGQNIRILIEAADADGASLVEAGVDDAKITKQ